MANDIFGVITKYVKLWPREVFYIKGDELVKDALKSSGVYVLYRDRDIFYVGKSARLFDRLWDHAMKRYVLWNHFSAFFVPEDKLDDVEAIVIAATNSEANKSSGKGIERVPLPVQVKQALLRHREIDPEG